MRQNIVIIFAKNIVLTKKNKNKYIFHKDEKKTITYSFVYNIYTKFFLFLPYPSPQRHAPFLTVLEENFSFFFFPFHWFHIYIYIYTYIYMFFIYLRKSIFLFKTIPLNAITYKFDVILSCLCETKRGARFLVLYKMYLYIHSYTFLTFMYLCIRVIHFSLDFWVLLLFVYIYICCWILKCFYLFIIYM